ncbi:MAG: hypothetical protein RBG13Loki_0911 [Promethearchaeota archaeon CR_4]|nr:MAG: hypothetical protein RBG13Loki_0911 [Candidatus Lokiarchaeota archaeon CR_4]
MIDNAGSVSFMLGYIIILPLSLLYLWRRSNIRENRPARWIYVAFIGLLLGDSFHLVARIIVYFVGLANGIELRPDWEAFYGQPVVIAYLGLGLAASAFTMQLFYLLIYVYWRKCNTVRWAASIGSEKRKTPGGMILLDINAVVMTILHTVLEFFPQNEWGAPTETLNVMRIITNIPFFIMGFQTIVVLLIQAKVDGVDSMPGFSLRERRMARNMAYLMIFSFSMYSLTVFLAWLEPMFGMTMLPKTVAYLFMLLVFVKGAFVKNNKRYELLSENTNTK